MTGVVIDTDVPASGPVAGNFAPFEGYLLGSGGEAAGTEPAVGSESDASAPGEAVERAATTAFTIEAGAVIAATGFDHYVPRKGEYG